MAWASRSAAPSGVGSASRWAVASGGPWDEPLAARSGVGSGERWETATV